MKKFLLLALGAALTVGLFFGSLIGQESTYLAQKLMLENDLRSRIERALGKILDDHRYVLDVAVDLKFTSTTREEVTFRPAEAEAKPQVTPAEEEQAARPSVPQESRRKKSRFTGLPIPGFEFEVEEGEEQPEVPTPPVGKEAEAAEIPEAPMEGAQIVSQSYADITFPVPIIERMEISCLLPERTAPELIENVRQIIMVTSHFDRSRGDVLSIMTASFKERRDERTAEAIILRSIAGKIDSLERRQAESEGGLAINWREEFLKWQEEEARRREEERAQLYAEIEKLKGGKGRQQWEEEQAKQREQEQEAWRQAALETFQEVLSRREEQARVEEDSARIAVLQNELAELRTVLDDLRAREQGDSAALVIQELQGNMKEREELRSGISNLPIYLTTAIALLAVIALAAVLLFNGRKPRYVVPPPWMMRPPLKKKVSKKEKKVEKEEAVAAPPPVAQAPPPPPAPPAPEQDPGVLQSEIRSVRQSIVSMGVAEPETAATIVKEWLEEEAPAEEVAEAPAEAAPPAEEETEKGKKKKKKKK